MTSDPVAGAEHVASDLRLDGVNVIHQARWAEDSAEEDEDGEEDDDQLIAGQRN
jgi:hypothetical protein